MRRFALFFTLLLPACATHHPTARDLNTQALTRLNANDDRAAEPLLHQSIATDPRFAPAHNNLGLLYFRQHKLPEAAAEFKTAADLSPQNPEPPNNLGLVYEATDHLDQAITTYYQALTYAPDDPQLLGNLARARLKRGDPPSDVRPLLVKLLAQDTRPEWLAWARQQLALSAPRTAP